MSNANELVMMVDRIENPEKRKEAFRVVKICLLATQEEVDQLMASIGHGLEAMKAALDRVEAEEIRTGRVLEC